MLKSIHPSKNSNGFTLIELSIILVIIGLLVGGVLIGKDLMRAAELRALLSQKDKYVSAMNIFKQKYNAIPGDMPLTMAAQFGMFTFDSSAWGAGTSYGNGDGQIDAQGYEIACNIECGAFWRHLYQSGLLNDIPDTPLEPDSDATCLSGVPIGTPSPCLNQPQASYMPKAKYGPGFFGVSNISASVILPSMPAMPIETNMFYIGLNGGPATLSQNAPAMTAIDAYTVDLKIDDGFPNKGRFATGTYGNLSYLYYSPSVNSTSTACVTGGTSAVDPNAVYNSNPSTGGNKMVCQPFFLWK